MKKFNMSKGYYLASLLHVLIRFYYGDIRDLPYFFILLLFFTMLHDYERVFMGHFEKLNKCIFVFLIIVT